MRLSNILTLPVTTAAEAERVGTLEDGLLDLRRRRVAYWRVQLSQRAASVLVSARKVEIGEAGVSVAVPRDALEAAASEEDTGRVASGKDTPQPDLLPAAPRRAKPSGLLAMLRSVLGRDAGRTPPPKPANAPENWVWGSEMRGAKLFAGEGQLGRIRDLEIEPGDQRLRRVQVAQRGGVTLHVRASALRHVPDDPHPFVAKSAVQLTETRS